MKSLGIFLVILFTGVLFTVFLLNTTNKNGASQDIRSHASNETDLMVDSDAVMAAGEADLNTVENDSDLQPNATAEAADDADAAEINAL
jgi:hypothetical protein